MTRPDIRYWIFIISHFLFDIPAILLISSRIVIEFTKSEIK